MIKIIRARKHRPPITRFYISGYLEGFTYEIQIDTGADVNLVSKEILDTIDPNWKSRQSIKTPKVKGVAGDNLDLMCSKIIPISFDRDEEFTLWLPFCVLKEGSQFLLSGATMHQERLGIEWNEQLTESYLVCNRNRVGGMPMKYPLRGEPIHSIASNMCDKDFLPGETKLISFSTSLRDGEAMVYNVSNQATNVREARDFMISPSLTDVIDGKTSALVKNMSYKPKSLHPRCLKAAIERIQINSSHSALDPCDPEKAVTILREEFNGGDMPLENLVVHNVSISTRRRLQEEESSLSHLFHSSDYHGLPPYERYTVNLVQALTEKREKEEEEKEDLLTKIYTEPHDYADFGQEVGADLGFDFGPEVDIWEQFDLDAVAEEYRPLVKQLIEDHLPLFAKSDMDCGDISRTLGTYSLPLKKPLPHSNHRTYYMQGKKRQDLKVILSMMLRNNLLKRVKSATFSSPIFLLSKKDKNALPRMLADVRKLNEHLLPIHQLVPKIQSLLEGMGTLKPVIFSSLDLASAFFSMVPDAKARKALVLSCEFGLFEALVGVQGVSSIPSLFSDFIFRSLHLDQEGNPDPIAQLVGYLDDVLAYSPLSSEDREMYQSVRDKFRSIMPSTFDQWESTFQSAGLLFTAYDHYALVDKVLSRLEFHNFRVKISKLKLFQKEATALGVIVSSQGLKIDPSRIDKITATPFPDTRKGMQSYCGFLSSVGLYSSNVLSHYHGILAELTSSKKKYEPEHKHLHAFEQTKELLISQPLFLDFPDQNKPKILYVDSSDILLGAVLLDVDLSEPVIQPNTLPYNSEGMQIREPKLLKRARDMDLHLIELRIPTKPGSSFFESISALLPILEIYNVPEEHKTLRRAVIFHLESGTLRMLKELYSGLDWNKFLLDYTRSNSGVDPEDLIIRATANYLGRQILILCDTGTTVRVFGRCSESEKKPPIWLGQISSNLRAHSRFVPLLSLAPSRFSPRHNSEKIVGDLPYMDRAEIFRQLQDHVNSPTDNKPLNTRVIGYMSKVISKDDRQQPIWKKEATALINGLGKFKPLIESSPAVLCLLDSQVVYFLSHNNLIESNLKAKRMGTLLHLEYPNLLISAIRSGANISDKMSRLFSLPKVVRNNIPLSKLDIPVNVPNIEGKAFSVLEAREKITELGELHSIKAISYDEEMIGPKIPSHMQTLLENINPIKTLKERLSTNNISLAQQKDKAHSTAFPTILKEDEHGIIRHKNEKTIWIPPSLEGVALSYLHLTGGHIGWTRLYEAVKKRYYFPGAKNKCKNLATTCQACAVSNPSCLRKTNLHSVVSSYPMEIITADLLEVDNIQGNQKHKILVICDYFTKALFAYDLKTTSARSFIEKLKEFLMMTGFGTKLLIVDNATYFSNRELLVFLSLVGIRKVEGNANHSQSRGLVESSIRILQTLIRKLLILSPKYNYEDLLFLAPVLLNSSTNKITGLTPYEALFGRQNESVIFDSPKRPHYRLFRESVKDDLHELRKIVSERVEDISQKINHEKQKIMEKLNKHRITKSVVPQGSIVFVRDYSIPKSGRARKFRPYFLKSPQIVISASGTSVVTMRLADSFVSRHHPDDLLLFKGEQKDNELYKEIPQNVLAFLGKPISSESLLELARKDDLELIYSDHMAQPTSIPLTRSKNSNRMTPNPAEIMEVIGDEVHDDESQDSAATFASPKRVTFSVPTEKQ